MAISYTVEKHTVCNPGNLLASDYGKHICSVELKDSMDNGRLVKISTMKSLDLWDYEDVTSIDAYIALKGSDGLWLVVVKEVKEVGTALIYQEPLIDEESPRKLTLTENFYNDPDDGAVRAYLLTECDRFWLSDEGFSGTPSVGATITTITDGKLVIA